MTNKKCPDCSAQVPVKAKFCPECGASLTSGKNGAGNSKQVQTGRKTVRRDTLVILALIVLVPAGYFIFKKPDAAPVNPTQTQSPHGEGNVEGMTAGLGDLPTDYKGLVATGNQLMDQANYPIAAECYKRALAIDGSSPDVRVDLGACLFGMGLPQRALEELRIVFEKTPGHSICNFNLGIVHFGLNQKDSARVYWSRYLELEPDGRAAETARAYLQELDKQTN
ncbi:MAG: tetratricopeptide repeat protein [candidate division Zixibacteria bacterium]|nr:tetratricopeptide repeat protein [candidate division Zixibacteria bacterium]